MITTTKSVSRHRKPMHWLVSVLICSAIATTASAGPREQAKRLHDRLAGTHPAEDVLAEMESRISSGDPLAAADLAMENDAFYNATLKNWITPWTNEDQTVFAPLNDYTATVIGIIRDGEDFRKILFDDVLYTADPSTGAPAYSMSNNNHYEYLENNNFSLKDVLVRRAQSSVTGLPVDATSGVITSRAAAQSFFIAGTNRAMFRFTLINHMCGDLEVFKDESRVPDRIRQDVSRSPGGDSRIFLNSCIGCHSGMDPLTQAWAYYNFEYDPDNDPEGENGQLVYNGPGDIDEVTGTRVTAKHFNNNQTFQYGFITTDNSWKNYWRQGQNALAGWDESLPGEGQGAKSMGQELAYSARFAQCQVQKVFKAVCLREPGNSADRTQVDNMIESFASSNYDIKQVFAESAVYCMGN